MLSTIFHYILNLFRQDSPNKVVHTERSLLAADSTSAYLRPIEDMTKKELGELGAANGVRLDRRRRKDIMVAKMKEAGIHHG